MTKRIVVDPITRIEGHLRMEADIERCHHRCFQYRDDDTGNRDHCQRPRSSRRLGIRRPSMRSLYLHTFALFCQGSRRCATHRHSAECRAGEKPHAIGRNHTRSRYTLLSITGSRLGRCHVGLECRPQKGSRSGAKPIGMA